jgi:hypothetical protein
MTAEHAPQPVASPAAVLAAATDIAVARTTARLPAPGLELLGAGALARGLGLDALVQAAAAVVARDPNEPELHISVCGDPVRRLRLAPA